MEAAREFKRYAWSTAQYIQIIIEKIFGLDYNKHTKVITIRPNLDDALTGSGDRLKALANSEWEPVNLISYKRRKINKY